jgi:hypothetical protein
MPPRRITELVSRPHARPSNPILNCTEQLTIKESDPTSAALHCADSRLDLPRATRSSPNPANRNPNPPGAPRSSRTRSRNKKTGVGWERSGDGGVTGGGRRGGRRRLLRGASHGGAVVCSCSPGSLLADSAALRFFSPHPRWSLSFSVASPSSLSRRRRGGPRRWRQKDGFFRK